MFVAATLTLGSTGDGVSESLSAWVYVRVCECEVEPCLVKLVVVSSDLT